MSQYYIQVVREKHYSRDDLECNYLANVGPPYIQMDRICLLLELQATALTLNKTI